MGIQSQADRRLKKSKPSYQRTNSQTFKMFDEAQIKEFKEIFGFLDQDGNGVIEVDDLVALHGIMGKPADEAALGAMIAEAPGPLDFQMLLQLFGEKMSGTDPEETIMAGWHLFDPSVSGEMNVDAVKALLCSRGVKADRLTEAEVAQMFDQVKPAYSTEHPMHAAPCLTGLPPSLERSFKTTFMHQSFAPKQHLPAKTRHDCSLRRDLHPCLAMTSNAPTRRRRSIPHSPESRFPPASSILGSTTNAWSVTPESH